MTTLTSHAVASKIREGIAVKESLCRDRETLMSIVLLAQMCLRTLRKNGTIMLCGNGGSAADSQHIACELQGRFKKKRSALAALALTTNTSTITAIGNDFGFAHIFSRQVEALAKKNDCVIGISTSGNSPNVIRAIQAAKKLRLATACLTGARASRLSRLCDISVCVPAHETPLIQESHITIGHIICELIENNL